MRARARLIQIAQSMNPKAGGTSVLTLQDVGRVMDEDLAPAVILNWRGEALLQLIEEHPSPHVREIAQEIYFQLRKETTETEIRAARNRYPVAP